MRKKRISLTIEKDLLRKVDSLIDGIKFRNRSQVVEFLLREALKLEKVSKAIILAGGKKEKLLYKDTYKPLYKVKGKPLILWILEKLKKANVSQITIAGGPITDQVFKLVGDGSELGLSISYIREKEPLGTAGVIKKIANKLDSTFFVIYGDEFFDFDLKEMINFHRSNRSLATIAIATTHLEKSKDFIKILGNKVVGFTSPAKETRSFYVSAGVFLFEPEALKFFPEKGWIEKDVLPRLIRSGRVYAFTFTGEWFHLE